MGLAGGVQGSGVTGSGFGFHTFVSKSDITLCVVKGAEDTGSNMIYNEFVSRLMTSTIISCCLYYEMVHLLPSTTETTSIYISVTPPASASCWTSHQSLMSHVGIISMHV
jgi:hypothetical protein